MKIRVLDDLGKPRRIRAKIIWDGVTGQNRAANKNRERLSEEFRRRLR